MNWLVFWIAAIATYRLTIFISRDKGPFGIFTKLRRTKLLGKWAACPFCVSPYCGIFVAATLFVSGIKEPIGIWILLVLAWSGVTIAVDRVFSSDVTNN